MNNFKTTNLETLHVVIYFKSEVVVNSHPIHWSWTPWAIYTLTHDRSSFQETATKQSHSSFTITWTEGTLIHRRGLHQWPSSASQLTTCHFLCRYVTEDWKAASFSSDPKTTNLWWVIMTCLIKIQFVFIAAGIHNTHHMDKSIGPQLLIFQFGWTGRGNMMPLMQQVNFLSFFPQVSSPSLFCNQL